jgi:hypothetical protein
MRSLSRKMTRQVTKVEVTQVHLVQQVNQPRSGGGFFLPTPDWNRQASAAVDAPLERLRFLRPSY